MNRQEFEVWKSEIYTTINEAHGIIGLSGINKDVGQHNNRTPEEIKSMNDKRAQLKEKVPNAMNKASGVIKNATKAGGEAVKNTAKAAGEKIAQVKNNLANHAKKNDTPVGLAGIAKQNKEPDNTNSKKPQTAQKIPQPKNNTKNTQPQSSMAKKFGNAIGNNTKSGDTPVGLAGVAKQKNNTKSGDTVGNNNTKQQKNNTKSDDTPVGLAGVAKQNKQKDEDETKKDNNKNEERKTLAQKLKQGAKGVAWKALNAYHGARAMGQSAKQWAEKANKVASEKQDKKWGVKKEAEKTEETKNKKDESENKETKTSTKNSKGSGNSNSNSNSNGGASINIRIHQARENAYKKQREDERKKDEEERNAFFRKVNGEEGEAPQSEEGENKESTSKSVKPSVEPTKEKDSKENKEDLKTKIAKVKSKAEKQPKTEAKNVDESPKKAEGETPEKDTEEPKKTKAKVEKPKKAEAKVEEPKTEAKAEEPKTEAKAEAKESDKGNKEPEPENAEKKEDLKAKVAKAKEATNIKIKKNPNESKYRKLTDEEVQNAEAKKLPSGSAKGSNTLQHVKTKGEEASRYDDENGKPVPTKPSEVEKIEDGKRTPNKSIVVKKQNQQKTTDNEKTVDNEKTTDNEKTVEKADEKREQSKEPTEDKKSKESTEDKKDLKTKVETAKEKGAQKEEKKPRTVEQQRAIMQAKAKREEEQRQKDLERLRKPAKAGHEKTPEEIKAHNAKIRAERGETDLHDTEDEVKKQSETVSSDWRKSFITKANKGETEGLPDSVKNLMGKYKTYWKKVNQKDYSMTHDDRVEGDNLEQELRKAMKEHPDAFGKKTTVKEGDKSSKKPVAPKKLDLKGLLNKKKEEKSSTDKFIEDATKEDEGPSDAELRKLERILSKKRKK